MNALEKQRRPLSTSSKHRRPLSSSSETPKLKAPPNAAWRQSVNTAVLQVKRDNDFFLQELERLAFSYVMGTSKDSYEKPQICIPQKPHNKKNHSTPLKQPSGGEMNSTRSAANSRNSDIHPVRSGTNPKPLVITDSWQCNVKNNVSSVIKTKDKIQPAAKKTKENPSLPTNGKGCYGRPGIKRCTSLILSSKVNTSAAFNEKEATRSISRIQHNSSRPNSRLASAILKGNRGSQVPGFCRTKVCNWGSGILPGSPLTGQMNFLHQIPGSDDIKQRKNPSLRSTTPLQDGVAKGFSKRKIRSARLLGSSKTSNTKCPDVVERPANRQSKQEVPVRKKEVCPLPSQSSSCSVDTTRNTVDLETKPLDSPVSTDAASKRKLKRAEMFTGISPLNIGASHTMPLPKLAILPRPLSPSAKILSSNFQNNTAAMRLPYDSLLSKYDYYKTSANNSDFFITFNKAEHPKTAVKYSDCIEM